MRYLSGLLLFILLVVGGCGRPNSPKVPMDELASDGYYHYSNQSLGFEVTLPPEFIYYQTQRKEREGMVDIEFWVPTSDEDYPTEVSSYALAFTVRVLPADDERNFQSDPLAGFERVSSSKERMFYLRFWEEVPLDWQNKWNKDKEEFIKNNFKSL